MGKRTHGRVKRERENRIQGMKAKQHLGNGEGPAGEDMGRTKTQQIAVSV